MDAGSPQESATVRLWSLSEDVLLEEEGDSSLAMVTRWGEVTVDATGGLGAALRRMALGPVFLHNVAGSTEARLEEVLERFSGSVVHSLGLPDGQPPPLLSATPLLARPRFRPRPVPEERPVRLSHFASLRPLDERLVLESPCAPFRVALNQPLAVRIATALTTPTTVGRLAVATDTRPEVVADVVGFLVAAGVVLVAGEDARFGEDEDPALRRWTPQELMFAAFSRARQMDAQAAALEETAGPVTKPVPDGPRVPLYRPDLAGDSRDPSLRELLETDHHCPAFSSRQLTAEAVGELLFRTARIRSIGRAHLPVAAGHDASQRPYFTIACLYELELYLTANRCSGLARGIYHYDPLAHALTLVQDDPVGMAAMLEMATVAAGNRCPPAALLTITSRRSRISWLFAGSAYATTLLHAGALQQTLHLAAQAIGLSAHAVVVDAPGTRDGMPWLDWPGETVVGECVLDC